MALTNLGSPPPAPVVDTTLLTTKLHVPRVHLETVMRRRLLDRLDTALHVPLTVIAAPAGFGKTTIVTQWLHAQSHPVAWVSLDATDNDRALFLRYLVAALQSIEPAVGKATLALLSAPQPPRAEVLLTPLLNELTTVSQDSVLVLDDYHVLRTPAIHEAVTFLVEHLPPSVHLVITTREDPPLPLTRLRARRQLVELRAADLRFTPDEATVFLHDVMRLPLSVDDVAALEQRTEGWIAGLHLAALAMQDRSDVAAFVRAFTGSNRFIFEYLVEDVVGRLPGHLHDFVLQTSILDRFCAPLCDAVVLGDAADPNASYSQVLLDQIDRLNLFLVPLDDERRWYRYHHLFADVVRERLISAVSQADMDQLHRRASVWFEQHHLVQDAIQHAVAAHDWERAASLIELHVATYFKRGEHLTVQGWLKRLPEAVIRARAELSLAYAKVCVWLNDIKAAQTWLDHAEQTLPEPTESSMLGPILAQRAALALHQGNYAQTVEHAQQALRHAAADDAALRAQSLLLLATASMSPGQSDATLQMFRDVHELALTAGDIHTALYALSSQGRTYFTQGRLHAAADAYLQGLDLSSVQHLGSAPVSGLLRTGLVYIHYEWNELETALAHATAVINLREQGLEPYVLLTSYRMLAKLHQALGDIDGARRAMQQALELAQRHTPPQQMVNVTAWQVPLWLAEGNLATAAGWVKASGLSLDEVPTPMQQPALLALMRVQMAEGGATRVVPAVRRMREQIERSNFASMLIEILALEAVALWVGSDRPTALATLQRGLALAEPEGYVRTFVDEGEPMQALLHEAAARQIAPTYVAHLLAAFPKRIEDAGEPMKPAAHAPQPASATAQPLAEPLSERELEVLRLVATGLSNHGIADKLIVGHNTVKKHLSNIYAKLGVQNRTAALAQARELQLL